MPSQSTTTAARSPAPHPTASIRHAVGIAAPASAVYQAFTDTTRLAGWWTSDTRGSGAAVGDILAFWFGTFCQRFEVIELRPNELVRWSSSQPDGMDEWSGTEISVTLSEDNGHCRVQFCHAKWRSDSGFFAHCSTKWAVFLVSLKNLLETGTGQPYPDDVAISLEECSASHARASLTATPARTRTAPESAARPVPSRHSGGRP